MKRLSMVVWLLISSVAMAAEMKGSGSSEKLRSDMGGQQVAQFSQMQTLQTVEESMIHDMSQMMSKINEMMGNMSKDMENMKLKEKEKIKNMSKIMSKMSDIMKDMAWYMDKGEMTESMTNNMQEKISDIEEMLTNK